MAALKVPTWRFKIVDVMVAVYYGNSSALWLQYNVFHPDVFLLLWQKRKSATFRERDR